MDREMMRALQMDAAMLEAMGAGEQPLAFETHAVGMRLTDAENDLWLVYDHSGNVLAEDLSMEAADAMLSQSSHHPLTPRTHKAGSREGDEIWRATSNLNSKANHTREPVPNAGSLPAKRDS
jgi:hypothetical protein